MDFTLDIINQGYKIPQHFDRRMCPHSYVQMKHLYYESIYKGKFTDNLSPCFTKTSGSDAAAQIYNLLNFLKEIDWQNELLFPFLAKNSTMLCGIGNLMARIEDYYLFWNENEFILETCCESNIKAVTTKNNKTPFPYSNCWYETYFKIPYFVSDKSMKALDFGAQNIYEISNYLNICKWYKTNLSDIIFQSPFLYDFRGVFQNVIAYSTTDDAFLIVDKHYKTLVVPTKDIRFEYNYESPCFDVTKIF